MSGTRGVGDCSDGVTVCVMEAATYKGRVQPGTEVAGGGDEDCDGSVDEGV